MIERHVTFHIHPGKEDEFRSFYRDEYLPAMSRTSGFVSASLLQDQELVSDLKMVLRFESLAAATEWRQSDAHQTLKPRLKSHYDESELTVYDVLE